MLLSLDEEKTENLLKEQEVRISLEQSIKFAQLSKKGGKSSITKQSPMFSRHLNADKETMAQRTAFQSIF